MGKILGSTSGLTLGIVALSAAIAVAVLLDYQKTRRGEVAMQVEKAESLKAAEAKKEKLRLQRLQNARELTASLDKAEAAKVAAERIAALEDELDRQREQAAQAVAMLGGKPADPVEAPDPEELERRKFLDKENAAQKKKRDLANIQSALVQLAAEGDKNAAREKAAVRAFGDPKPHVTPDWKRLTRLLGKPDPKPHKFTAEEIAKAEEKREAREKVEALKRQYAAWRSLVARNQIMAIGGARAEQNATIIKGQIEAGAKRALGQ